MPQYLAIDFFKAATKSLRSTLTNTDTDNSSVDVDNSSRFDGQLDPLINQSSHVSLNYTIKDVTSDHNKQQQQKQLDSQKLVSIKAAVESHRQKIVVKFGANEDVKKNTKKLAFNLKPQTTSRPTNELPIQSRSRPPSDRSVGSQRKPSSDQLIDFFRFNRNKTTSLSLPKCFADNRIPNSQQSIAKPIDSQMMANEESNCFDTRVETPNNELTNHWFERHEKYFENNLLFQRPKQPTNFSNELTTSLSLNYKNTDEMIAKIKMDSNEVKQNTSDFKANVLSFNSPLNLIQKKLKNSSNNNHNNNSPIVNSDMNSFPLNSITSLSSLATKRNSSETFEDVCTKRVNSGETFGSKQQLKKTEVYMKKTFEVTQEDNRLKSMVTLEQRLTDWQDSGCPSVTDSCPPKRLLPFRGFLSSTSAPYGVTNNRSNKPKGSLNIADEIFKLYSSSRK